MPGLSEVGLIGQDSEELGDVKDDVCGWGSFGVDVDVGVEEFKDFKDQVAQFECVVFIEIDKGDFGLEWGFVQEEYDLFDVLWGDVFLEDEC